MKQLTLDELNNAPDDVQHVWLCSVANIPIGMSRYEEVVTKYPEYFPEETEHRRKWKAIPQEVHDAFWKEWQEMRERVYKEVPESKGIVGRINDPKYAKEFDRLSDKAFKVFLKAEAELRNKYYKKFG